MTIFGMSFPKTLAIGILSGAVLALQGNYIGAIQTIMAGAGLQKIGDAISSITITKP